MTMTSNEKHDRQMAIKLFVGATMFMANTTATTEYEKNRMVSNGTIALLALGVKESELAEAVLTSDFFDLDENLRSELVEAFEEAKRYGH